MNNIDNEMQTTYKTLWSESILEVLYLALNYNKPDKDIMEILNLIRLKGKKSDYIIDKVKKKVGEDAASRVEKLLQ